MNEDKEASPPLRKGEGEDKIPKPSFVASNKWKFSFLQGHGMLKD